MEQVRVLGHHADRLAQRLQGHVPYVEAADAHRARGESYSRDTSSVIVVLPAPEWPDQGDQLPGRGGERHVVQHLLRTAPVSGRAIDSSEASETSEAAG